MPRSPRTAPSWALLLRLLALLRPPGLSEACSCAPAHPQQHVCHSALVIRAKISSEKVVPASTDPGDTQKMIRYEIKQIKMFKGFEKISDIQYIYTPFDSSLCGVKLETNSQKQYLLTGLHPQHMEVPRIGVESEMELPTCTTAAAMPDSSHICDLYRSSQLCQILNPLSEARDLAQILLDTSQVHFHRTTTGTPGNSFDIKTIEAFLVPSLSPMSPLPPKDIEEAMILGSRSSTSKFLMLGSLPSPFEGQILSDGKVFIHLCNYIEPWENLSFLQRESLNHHYHLNCGCQITTCYVVPCTIAAPNECLWTDWLLEQKLYGYQAQHYVCMKHADGTCSWYQGRLHLRKEFVDIIQP